MLVGHSMGATIITLAEANHPGFAEKIILIEPIFLPENIYGALHRVEDHPLASKSIKRRNFWKDAAEAAEYLRTRALFKNWDPEMLELYLKYGMKQAGNGLVLACSPAQEAALFMGGAARNPWPEVSKVLCPVLVVEGGESENRGFIDSQKIASLFPNGEYHLVQGAGHLIPMEMPKEIFKIIDNFFSPPLKA
jgi:pimeloyl-ACP methyl ester carboxylesterase